MNDIEKKVREHSTQEAIRKNLMGKDGKLGVILNNLGFPIITHGGGMFESNEMPDYSQLPEEREEENSGLPTMDEDESVSEIGTYFDALGSGLHLEIKHLAERKELQVTYKGFIVYREIAGDLDCYFPMPEWEQHVDGLYAIAKRKENKGRYGLKKAQQEEAKNEKLGFLEKLKQRWGF